MSNITSWLARYFKASINISSGEAQFACPRCGHPNFYFNFSQKRIGFCHRANCHYSPTLKELKEIVGDKSPLDEFSEPIYQKVSQAEAVEISLPEGTQRLVELISGTFRTSYPHTSQKVAERGVSQPEQYKFNLHIGDGRVYIPVYYEGKMISYLGRSMWWLPIQGLRYQNAEGTKLNEYFFNWDEGKSWNRLTLLENTFNAMWLRQLQATSTFGSNLGDRQIEHILYGKAESVLLLWDEGADKSAWKAVRRLRKRGVPASFAKITGQPDDHELEYLSNVIEVGHAAALEGKHWVNFRTEK